MKKQCLGGAIAMLMALVGTTSVAQAQMPPTTGACSGGGSLQAQPGEDNRPWSLLKDPTFAKQHATVTAKDAPWLQLMDGPGKANRVYTAGQSTVVVFHTCQQRNCGDNAAYGAFESGAVQYGLLVTESGRERPLGKMSAAGIAAIKCAASYDKAVIKSVEALFSKK